MVVAVVAEAVVAAARPRGPESLVFKSQHVDSYFKIRKNMDFMFFCNML